MIVARRADLLDELAARIAETGGTATAIPCDLADLDAVDALADTVEQRFGGLTSWSTMPGGHPPAAGRIPWTAGMTSNGP